jgi:hypothetical protein
MSQLCSLKQPIVAVRCVISSPNSARIKDEDQQYESERNVAGYSYGQGEDAERVHGGLALKRELGVAYVSVGLNDAKFRIDTRYVTVRLPLEVRRKIWFWEKFAFARPFSFDFPNVVSSSDLASRAISHQVSIGRSLIAVATQLAKSVIAQLAPAKEVFMGS